MLIQNLPVGARLERRDGTFSYLVASHDQPGYPGTTLLSRNVVLIGPFDAAEPDNPKNRHPDNRAEFGSGVLKDSNLLQWLNSGEKAWFRAKTPWDTPPESCRIHNGARGYQGLPGYLTALPPQVREALLETEVPVHTLDGAGRPALEYVAAKVFLPSRTELGLGDDYGIPEGSPLPLLRDVRMKRAYLTAEAAERYSGPWQPQFPMKDGCIWRYWLRSPHLRNRYLVRYVAEMGGLSFAKANYEIVGVRPMMNVRNDLAVEDTAHPGNLYYLKEES